jgi:hypothetical protein
MTFLASDLRDDYSAGRRSDPTHQRTDAPVSNTTRGGLAVNFM